MRAAPSIGAMLMALSLAHLPPFRHAGRTLLLAVAGFGVATIIFGLSRNFWLSVLMLFSLGALDNISVVIRTTLILVRTPDEMRGRTSAVNSIFIGASNELGGFESGAAAALFGPVVAVVGGGIGTILVVLGVAKVFPELLNLRSLDMPLKMEPIAATSTPASESPAEAEAGDRGGLREIANGVRPDVVSLLILNIRRLAPDSSARMKYSYGQVTLHVEMRCV